MGKVDFVHSDSDRTTIWATFFPAGERKIPSLSLSPLGEWKFYTVLAYSVAP
jgi:hypothetical protein